MAAVEEEKVRRSGVVPESRHTQLLDAMLTTLKDYICHNDVVKDGV